MEAVESNPTPMQSAKEASMKRVRELERRTAALQDRLTKLSEASLRINESLELDVVLQGVLDSARSLTDARYGVMTTLDESGRLEDLMASGMTEDEFRALREIPGGPGIFEYFSNLPEPLRVRDFAGHTRSLGLSEFPSPMPVSSCLAAPIRHRGDGIGNIYVAKSEAGEEFSREDEETLGLFASQAALVLANARQHRDERRARADLQTLIDTSPVGVVVFDARTGEPTSFNREARRIVDDLRNPGQSPEDMLGALTFRRADGREISLAEFPLAQAMSIGETVRLEEIVLSVPDDRSVTTLVNATPIRTEDGDVESYVVTLQDMSPLEKLDRLRAEFLGMASHELRTPLTAIRGSATTLLDASSEMDPTELRQFLRIILDQADSMRDLIGGLLDMARIQTGTLPVSPEPSEVAALVAGARNTFLSGGVGRNLDIDLAPDLPLVMADRRRIVQVIGALLSNAAGQSPESSVIRVSAVREDVYVAVSVAGESQRMPAEQLSSLFRNFSRIEGEDNGLGLAICKGIVEAHGGRILIDSGGPGLGARFTFTIPAVEDPAAEYAQPSVHSPQTMRGETVLVVDDDPQTLRYVRNALSDAGYDPIVTTDPEEALGFMGENQPHLVLLDMMLPSADDSIDLMRSVFRIAEAPVVFFSGYGQDEVIARAFEAGAADYVVKPFSPTELIARVRAALRRREGPRQAEPSEPYAAGGLTIDYAARIVTLAGRPVKLTAKEYDLLFTLSVNAGRVLSYEQLRRQVWGLKRYVDNATIRSVVKRLRRKLGEDSGDPAYIFAEPRVGYRMLKADTPAQEGA